jgi:hypothetical protein
MVYEPAPRRYAEPPVVFDEVVQTEPACLADAAA